jgi:hypothetical protein
MRGCRAGWVASFEVGRVGAVGPCAVVRGGSGGSGGLRALRAATQGWLHVPTCPTVCQHSIWAGCSNTCFGLMLLVLWLVAILPFYCTVELATLKRQAERQSSKRPK